MAEEETKPLNQGNPKGDPDETTRSYRRAGMLGAILFLISALYLLISPGVSTTPPISTVAMFLHLAMQLGFVGSYVLLLVSVAGVARPGPASVFVGLITNGYVLFGSLQFFWVPRGASIRPMGWAMFVFLVSLVCFVTVAVLCIQGVRKDRTYGWMALSLPLGMSPFLIAGGVLQFAAWLNGFTLSP